MYEGGLEKMKLDRWDWVWIIFDILIIVLYSYFGVIKQDVSLWNKIVSQILVVLSAINFGLTLDKAGK